MSEDAAENDAGLRFRVETACDGYSALWESDVPDDVLSAEDYLRGAHDAAEAIRACTTPPKNRADYRRAQRGL